MTPSLPTDPKDLLDLAEQVRVAVSKSDEEKRVAQVAAQAEKERQELKEKFSLLRHELGEEEWAMLNIALVYADRKPVAKFRVPGTPITGNIYFDMVGPSGGRSPHWRIQAKTGLMADEWYEAWGTGIVRTGLLYVIGAMNEKRLRREEEARKEQAARDKRMETEARKKEEAAARAREERARELDEAKADDRRLTPIIDAELKRLVDGMTPIPPFNLYEVRWGLGYSPCDEDDDVLETGYASGYALTDQPDEQGYWRIHVAQEGWRFVKPYAPSMVWTRHECASAQDIPQELLKILTIEVRGARLKVFEGKEYGGDTYILWTHQEASTYPLEVAPWPQDWLAAALGLHVKHGSFLDLTPERPATDDLLDLTI